MLTLCQLTGMFSCWKHAAALTQRLLTGMLSGSMQLAAALNRRLLTQRLLTHGEAMHGVAMWDSRPLQSSIHRMMPVDRDVLRKHAGHPEDEGFALAASLNSASQPRSGEVTERGIVKDKLCRTAELAKPGWTYPLIKEIAAQIPLVISSSTLVFRCFRIVVLCSHNSLGAQSASHLGFTTLLSTFLGSVGLLGFFEARVLWGPMRRKVTPWDETREALIN